MQKSPKGLESAVRLFGFEPKTRKRVCANQRSAQQLDPELQPCS